MYLEFLPNELVAHVLHHCDTIQDALNLAATCRRFQHVLAARRVTILADAVETQYGPLKDAIQVATYNASQSAHLVRKVPYSMALIKQVVRIGIVAQKWIDVFPRRKWKDDFASRRLLTDYESWRVRRAIYRLWLYSKAFHNDRYKRTTRMQLRNIHERAELLHNWTNEELAEIEDVRQIVREELASNVCPSNGTIQKQFRRRYPESNQQLLFNYSMNLNYAPPAPQFGRVSYAAVLQGDKPSHAQVQSLSNYKLLNDGWHNAGDEGWGDEIPHYYVIEDMLKLDPGEIMFLKENAPLKGMVDAYVKNCYGEWFENNGETFGATLEWVMAERGEDMWEMIDAIEVKGCGIVIE